MVVDIDVRDATESEAASQTRCETYLCRAVDSNRFVKFMLHSLERAGCPVRHPSTNCNNGHHPADGVNNSGSMLMCRHCDADVGGGFQEDGGIVLCSNHILSQDHASVTLVHEMVHAFDQCRAHIDWSNCTHHACSEIRAAALSGDCDWLREVNRGHMRLGGQFKRCIKRRAEISVRMNRNCTPLQAREAVERAFEACYNDTAPFERIP